jgi:dihydropteroate synthase
MSDAEIVQRVHPLAANALAEIRIALDPGSGFGKRLEAMEEVEAYLSDIEDMTKPLPPL